MLDAPQPTSLLLFLCTVVVVVVAVAASFPVHAQGVVPMSKPDYIPVATAPSLSAKAAQSSAVAPQSMIAALAMALLLALLL